MRTGRIALSTWNVVLVVALAVSGILAATIPQTAQAAGDFNVPADYPTIQAGIDAAAAAGGGTVHVAAGTYHELVTLANDVTVQGAGQDVTIINGDTDDDEEGEGSVVSAYNVDSTATLDGFTVTNGTGTLLDTLRHGGGMYDSNSSPTVNNCTFFGNSATGDGGGMYDSNSSPTVNNCTFSYNSATGGGGGMYNSYSSPTVDNCTFSRNSATGDGGGMYDSNSSPTVHDCWFSYNSATGDGGGMCNSYSSPAVTNCTFGSSATNHGGGMYNAVSSPTLTNCTFFRSTAEHGGGIYSSNSSLTVTNCTFRANSATYDGGGMYNAYSTSPPLTDCTFRENSASRYGGAMFNRDSSPTLTNCNFLQNSATDSGGGMYNAHASSPTLTNCTFSSNSANDGGGMFNWFASSPGLTSCTFSGNLASDDGGGMYNSSSSPTVTNCTFSGNSATGTGLDGGGGMYNYGSFPTVANCTFSNNSAGDVGGGMYNDRSPSSMTNCTFYGNSAATEGGAMYNRDGSSPTLTNCVLWGDTPQEISHDSSSSSIVTYCDIDLKDPAAGPYAGIGNINADPLVADAASGDFHLRRGSPCIEAGTNDAPSLPDTDFDGQPRIMDGDHDGTATVDMGVDECFTNRPPVAADDHYVVNEDRVLGIFAPGVLGNDSDPDGDRLTAVLIAGPAHGTVTLNPNGSFTYSPAPNYNGPDNFTYKAYDGIADSNVATVSIEVKPVNDAPVAVDDEYTMDADSVLTVPAPGLLGNDTDPDGDLLKASVVVGPTHGSVTLSPNGSFTYTPIHIPPFGFFGTDTFTYKVFDGEADSNVATVTIHVRPRWDIGHDGVVNYKDLAVLGSAYGTTTGDEEFKPDADINQDGKVDYKDLAVLGAHYGETC